MAKIALDIDSTLHHYWELLDRISQDRYGVELPYETQRDWGITVLEREQLIDGSRSPVVVDGDDRPRLIRDGLRGTLRGDRSG